MGDQTAIEWTDATANFWRGCDKVSPGCAHCYMFDGQRRWGNDPSVVTLAAPATFNAPLSRKWRAGAAEVAEREHRRMRVFTCSWSDFFHEAADDWRLEAWDVIRDCPEYDWQILTKRPELIASRLPSDWGDGWPHVWLGVSIENRRYVHRADLLRETPAAVRFISAEPLLGPLVHERNEHGCFRSVSGRGNRTWSNWVGNYDGPELDLTDIDWLICGGESGPGHRPMREEWVRDLRDACLSSCDLCHARDAGIMSWCDRCKGTGQRTAFFFKQDSGPRPGSRGRFVDEYEWPREMPSGVSG